MKLTTPNNLIELGLLIRSATNMVSGDAADGDGGVCSVLTRLGDNLQKNNFPVTSEHFHRFIAPIGEKLKSEIANSDQGTFALRLIDAQALSTELSALERMISAEAVLRTVCIPVDARFKSNTLLHTPTTLLRAGIYERMSKLAQTDYHEGCKALSLGCCTASAFHVLRCVEEGVRALYRSHFPRGDSSRAWGVLTNELKRKNRNPKPTDLLMAQLDLVRQKFRNPTQHPEKEYDLDEASDLLFSSLELFGRIYTDQKFESKL
jgi:hypothetical protein